VARSANRVMARRQTVAIGGGVQDGDADVYAVTARRGDDCVLCIGTAGVGYAQPRIQRGESTQCSDILEKYGGESKHPGSSIFDS